MIEGEEFDAAPHARRHKPEVHDLDDYEEETLPSNMRPGDLGEMLQEAHLDHRIQRNLDEQAGDEEEDEAAEEEESGDRQHRRFAAANAAIAGSVGAGPSVAAVPRAARRRLPTCRSSRTC